MTQKQLERKVRYWQKILKLDHWDITCTLVHSIDTDGRLATSTIQAEYLDSDIKVQDPKYYKHPQLEDPFDRIIIHELLHCHFKLACPSDETHQCNEVERTITCLEKAFYDLWAGE